MAYARTKVLTGQTFAAEVVMNGATDATWNDCEVIGGTFQNGIYVTNVTKLRINGADITAVGIALYIEQTGSQDVEVYNNFIHDCGKEGIYVNEGDATTAPRHINMRIINNRLRATGKGTAPGDTAAERHGIDCWSKGFLIEGNDIDGVTRGHGIKVHSTGTVTGNTVKNCGRDGIGHYSDRTPGGGQLLISYNMISAVGQRTDSGTRSGIAIYTGPNNATVEIVGNTITTAPKPTITVQAPATAYVHENVLDGVGSLPSSGGGTTPPVTGALGEPVYGQGTVAIMMADGPDGTAVLSDGDGRRRGKPVLLLGGAKMVAYGEAGQRAVRLDGTAGCMIEVTHAELAMGTDDLVVEVLYRADAVAAGATLFDLRGDDGTGGYALGITATQLRVLAAAADIGGGAHSGLSKPTYAAFARTGGTCRLYGGLRSAATAGLLASIPNSLAVTRGRVRFGAGVRGLVIGVRVSRRTGRGMTPLTIPVVKAFPAL